MIRFLFTKSARVTVFACLLVVGSTNGVGAGIVYQQNPQYPGGFNALTSQDQASGANFQAYDNFTLNSTATVAALTWQGFYWNPNGQVFNPPNPNTIQFKVGFFQNHLGLPGNLIGSAITLSNVQSAIVGNSSFGPDNNGQFDTVQIRNYSANLNTSFTASAGTTYWVSIVSFSSNAPPLWLWTSGTGGNGLSAQLQYNTNNLSQQNGDRAFSLYTASLTGTPPPVPEPGTLPLGVIALAAVVLFRRVSIRRIKVSGVVFDRVH